MNYACEAAIGAVSGLRSFTGPAIVSEAANRHLIDLKGTPLEWLASKETANTAMALAAGELIFDKLPFTPDRTQLGALAARFATGGVSAAAIARTRSRDEQIKAAIIGGTAALAAAWLGFEYRKRVKLPKVLAALLEDTVAVAAGTAIVARACPQG